MKQILYLSLFIVIFAACSSKKGQVQPIVINDTISIRPNMQTTAISLEFIQGKSHNHPSFAIWIEDTNGNFLETIFVTKSVGTGIYGHAQGPNGTWKNYAGAAYRPAALPYWMHRKTDIYLNDNAQTSQKTIDAIVGATPKASFLMNAKTKQTYNFPIKIMVEVNQPWDWNAYWTNDKFSGDSNYATSCQPSIIYSAIYNNSAKHLQIVGRGHHAGSDGNMYFDTNNLTTAKSIFETILIKQKENLNQ